MPTIMARRPHRWWMLLVASIYTLALCLNAWVEAFGPAGIGLQYTVRDSPGARPFFEVENVLLGSPLEQAGAQAGDVIERADRHAISGQTDWFLARSHFAVDRPIELWVRRGQEKFRLSVTVTRRNWRTWDPGVLALQITRIVALLVALTVVFLRPSDLRVRLVSLLFAMVAVAEAFPPAGWAATLQRWPPPLSIPIALASVSWLLISVPWLSLAMRFPRPMAVPSWVWAATLAPLIVFAPLMLLSAVAVVYEPSSLAMPLPFIDLARTRALQSIWGVIPTLFINPWPLYQPGRHQLLLQLWAVLQLLWWMAGSVAIVLASRRIVEESERRLIRLLVVALAAVWGIGIHNVFVRNWGYWFGYSPPGGFSTVSLVAEAVGFVFLAVTLAYWAMRHTGATRST